MGGDGNAFGDWHRSVCLLFGLAASGDVLKIAFDAADLKTLDPHYAAATMDRAVVDMVFNGLVRYRPGDITVFEPDLAESWKISDDGLVWTFHLRRGVMVHPYPGNPDGYELTSEDVVFSLNKAANPDTSAYAGEYTGLTFEAVDRYTVRITLDRALSPALFLPKVADYAGGFIVPKAAYEALGEDFRTHPVGTGPFMFSDYVPTQKVVLVKNDRYFRGSPKLDGVEVWYMPDVNARLNGLLTGELNVIEGGAGAGLGGSGQGLPGPGGGRVRAGGDRGPPPEHVQGPHQRSPGAPGHRLRHQPGGADRLHRAGHRGKAVCGGATLPRRGAVLRGGGRGWTPVRGGSGEGQRTSGRSRLSRWIQPGLLHH